MVRHGGRFTAANIVGALISILGKGLIIAINVWLTAISCKSFDVK